MTSEDLFLTCTISRSGFPDDRVFRVEMAGGGTHVGAAPVEYFLTQKREPLKENQPPAGESTAIAR